VIEVVGQADVFCGWAATATLNVIRKPARTIKEEFGMRWQSQARNERLGSVVEMRPLEEADATAFEEAFAEMGWSKPAAQFIRYFREQEAGCRTVLVAEWEGTVAGYVTILWESMDPIFSSRDIPEIKDFNVLRKCRRMGIGSALMDAAEAIVAERSPVVGLGVGLHPGYGSAQRLYVQRGYVPDGAGVVVDGNAVPEGSEIRLDDGPMLRMTKQLE